MVTVTACYGCGCILRLGKEILLSSDGYGMYITHNLDGTFVIGANIHFLRHCQRCEIKSKKPERRKCEEKKSSHVPRRMR